MPASIVVPARVEDESDAELCVDGVCDTIILDSHPRREGGWTRYIAQNGLASFGHVEVYRGHDDFTMVIVQGQFTYTWEGDCAPAARGSLSH